MKHRRKCTVPDVLAIIVVIATVLVIIWAVVRLNARLTRTYNEEIVLDIEPQNDSQYAETTVAYTTLSEESTSSEYLSDVEEEIEDDFEWMIVFNAERPYTRVIYEINSVESEIIEYAEEEVMYEASPPEEIVEQRYVCEDRIDITFSDTDIRMLAALVTLEVGAESYECQQAVASVVINRMIIYDQTLSEVIYQPNLFSVSRLVESTEPFDKCVDAVKDVVVKGTTIPRYVTYFRADDYHDWGDRYVSWRQIDKTYFTYDSKLKSKWE